MRLGSHASAGERVGDRKRSVSIIFSWTWALRHWKQYAHSAVLLLSNKCGAAGFDVSAGFASKGYGNHSPGAYIFSVGGFLRGRYDPQVPVSHHGRDRQAVPAGFAPIPISLVDPDLPDQHSGNQHFGESCAVDRSGAFRGWMGDSSVGAVLAGPNLGALRWADSLPNARVQGGEDGKGYATAAHLVALSRFGPLSLHRRSPARLESGGSSNSFNFGAICGRKGSSLWNGAGSFDDNSSATALAVCRTFSPRRLWLALPACDSACPRSGIGNQEGGPE